MRFARGTKVQIKYTTPSGRSAFVWRWWTQVDAVVAKYRAAGCSDFYVRGRGWKDWRPYSGQSQ